MLCTSNPVQYVIGDTILHHSASFRISRQVNTNINGDFIVVSVSWNPDLEQNFSWGSSNHTDLNVPKKICSVHSP